LGNRNRRRAVQQIGFVLLSGVTERLSDQSIRRAASLASQIEANRRNAGKSTGPTTEEGKQEFSAVLSKHLNRCSDRTG
jgi:hypothetical protein